MSKERVCGCGCIFLTDDPPDEPSRETDSAGNPYCNSSDEAKEMRRLFAPDEHCHAGKDGECNWAACPQAVRWLSHCPLDVRYEDE